MEADRVGLIKIPDSMLSAFTCVKCNRYVTMAPIAIEMDGKISCGNCTDWTVSKVRCNLLESLAKLYSFPCKYRDAGCSQYLSFNTSFKHESKCEFHTYPCPIGLLNNNCKWVGRGANMLKHYKKQHPQFAAVYPNFKITLEDEYEKYYMIEVDHILLLLQIKSSVSEKKLWFNTVYIGEPKKAHLIRYSINLSCEEVSKQVLSLQTKAAVGLDDMKMDIHKCLEISKESTTDLFEGAKYIHCSWIINVYTNTSIAPLKTEALKCENELRMIEIKLRNTLCPNCNVIMAPPIYYCDSLQHHITCVDCKGYYKECKMCQKNGMTFKRAEDVEMVCELKFYNCRWLECEEVLTSKNIRLHEQQCIHRIYKCPKCYVWSGKANSLLIHFSNVHLKVRITSTNPLWFNSNRFVSGYIFTYNELFHFDVEKNILRQATRFCVTYLGAPGQIQDWECKVLARNGENIPQLRIDANVILFKPRNTYTCYKLSIAKIVRNDDDS